MTVIDLDRPVEEPAVRARPRPRTVLVGVVAMLSLLVVTGSARPGPAPTGRILWSIPVTAEDLIFAEGGTGDLVCAADATGAAAADPVTGRLAWRRPDATAFDLITGERVLLIDAAPA
jgi:hypothetical protein